MSIENVKIQFNLDKENDRRAYNYSQRAEKSYSKAVISAICGFMKLSERMAAENAFLERVIATNREETAKRMWGANCITVLLKVLLTAKNFSIVRSTRKTEVLVPFTSSVIPCYKNWCLIPYGGWQNTFRSLSRYSFTCLQSKTHSAEKLQSVI